MTTLNTAFAYSFASDQASKIAQGDRTAEDAVATQLRQAVSEDTRFTVGSTITARYQYKVAPDGTLTPIQTQIMTDAPRDDLRDYTSGDRRPRRFLQQNDDEHKQKLSDLTNPKPQLSPSDEAAVFASIVPNSFAHVDGDHSNDNLPPLASNVTANTAMVTAATAEAIDEDGTPIQAEILTPQPTSDAAPGFSPKAQFSVASLYARNSELTYNVVPLAEFAA